jgi:predicted dehydrogenase
MRRLRMGMVGGGLGSFIGPVHRLAAEMDREIELVAGAFAQTHARSQAAGAAYGIDITRAYANVETMVAAEKKRAEGIDFIAITSPNHHHLPAAQTALEAGIAVLTDKPLTATLAEAHTLASLVAAAQRPFGVTYTYAGYPMVREAKAQIAAGALGTIRKLVVEYAQGWLSDTVESKQAAWRLDPRYAGLGGCIGDIGVHAFHLAEFISGLRVQEMLPDLGAVVQGRVLDDDCSILLRFNNGARGALLASQIETGELNGLKIRIYGDKAGLEWRQEQPNDLLLKHKDGRLEIFRTGMSGMSQAAQTACRIPAGHPEGYLEAFANLYRDFAAQMRGESAPLLPSIEDGVRGMAFIECAVRGSKAQAGWVTLGS